MYRTNSILMIYGFPALVLAGVLLSALGVRLPWYAWVIVFPLGALALTLSVGAVALSREQLRVIELLCNALEDDNPEVRWAAAESLAQKGDARAVEPLCRALQDPDVSVKRAVARALERVGDERAFEPLCRALTDPDIEMQAFAAEALVRIDPKRAIDPLSQGLHSSAAEVSWSIFPVLVRLTGANEVVASYLRTRKSGARRLAERERKLLQRERADHSSPGCGDMAGN